MTKPHHIPLPLHFFPLFPHRRRPGQRRCAFPKSRNAYDYNNVLIRKMIDTDGDGAMDAKPLFLPENYQTVVQLDDSDLSDSTGPTVSHRYLWTPNQQDNLIADEQVTASGSNVLWTLTDHFGTVRDIIQQTSTGIIQSAHIIYDACGNVLSCKDSNGTDIESPVIFGFTGKYFDADTKLQNNVNRWYDATTGRWLSTDPIGFEGADTNLYRYVGNNQINLNDTFGLRQWTSQKQNALRMEEYKIIINIYKNNTLQYTLNKTSLEYDKSLIIEKAIKNTLISISYATDALNTVYNQFINNPETVKCCIEKIYKSNDKTIEYKFEELKKRLHLMVSQMKNEKIKFCLLINEKGRAYTPFTI